MTLGDYLSSIESGRRRADVGSQKDFKPASGSSGVVRNLSFLRSSLHSSRETVSRSHLLCPNGGRSPVLPSFFPEIGWLVVGVNASPFIRRPIFRSLLI